MDRNASWGYSDYGSLGSYRIEVTFSFTGPPVIARQPEPSQQQVVAGSSLSLDMVARGGLPLAYRPAAVMLKASLPKVASSGAAVARVEPEAFCNFTCTSRFAPRPAALPAKGEARTMSWPAPGAS